MISTKQRRVCLAIAVILAVFATAGVAAADTNATDDGVEYANTSTVIYEFAESDARITGVEFTNDDRARVTVESDTPESIAVSDRGLSSEGSFDVNTVEIQGTETIEIDLRDERVISINTPQDGYLYDARDDDTGTVGVIQSAATVELVQWGVLSGAIGATGALGVVVAGLRRRHSNTYKELTSEERVKIESDPVEGWVDRLQRTVAENSRLLIGAGALLAYLGLWGLGVAPSPSQIWAGMTDGMRVVAIGSVVALVLALLPVYLLARRLWNPRKEFVVSCDARDVIEEALGSDGGLSDMVEAIKDEDEPDGDSVGLAIYSGAPERISEMDVDGAATETRVPGGPLHVVQGFDASRNTAEGTWPGTATDIELITERSKIDANRELLRDESAMLRTLVSALPAIQSASDSAAVRSVDKTLRELVAIDGAPVDGILQRAAEGTRFEGLYESDDLERVVYEEPDEDDEPEAEA